MIPTEWLRESYPTTEAAFEAYVKDLNIRGTSDFEAMQRTKANALWAEFTAKMLPGDVLWRFESEPWSWDALCGRRGFCIMRDGAVVAVKTTWMS